MAVQFIRIQLQIWSPDGRPVSYSEFALPLKLSEADPAIGRISVGKSRYEASLIVFSELECQADPGNTERSMLFAANIERAFEQIAAWLNDRPSKGVRSLQQSGLKVNLFIGLWIDNDQLDLSLPPSFLQACGRQNLRIEIITND